MHTPPAASSVQQAMAPAALAAPRTRNACPGDQRGPATVAERPGRLAPESGCHLKQERRLGRAMDQESVIPFTPVA